MEPSVKFHNNPIILNRDLSAKVYERFGFNLIAIDILSLPRSPKQSAQRDAIHAAPKTRAPAVNQAPPPSPAVRWQSCVDIGSDFSRFRTSARPWALITARLSHVIPRRALYNSVLNNSNPFTIISTGPGSSSITETEIRPMAQIPESILL